MAVANHSLRASSAGTPSIPSYPLRSESDSDTPCVAGPSRVLRHIFQADLGRLGSPSPRVAGHTAVPRGGFIPGGRIAVADHSPSGVLRRHAFHALLPLPLRITFPHATRRRTSGRVLRHTFQPDLGRLGPPSPPARTPPLRIPIIPVARGLTIRSSSRPSSSRVVHPPARRSAASRRPNARCQGLSFSARPVLVAPAAA